MFFLGILIDIKDKLSHLSSRSSSSSSSNNASSLAIEELDQVAAHAESFSQCSPKSKKGLQTLMDTLDREGEIASSVLLLGLCYIDDGEQQKA